MMNSIKYQLNSFNENYDILRNTGGRYYKPFVFVDYIGCMIKYKASAADFFEYEFYNKKGRKREEFACWGLKKKFFHKMNDYFFKQHPFLYKLLISFQNLFGINQLDAPTATGMSRFHNQLTMA